MKRPLGTQVGTGQGHGSQRWLKGGEGGGFCGLSTKERQVEGSEGGEERDEGRSKALFPVSASLIPFPTPHTPSSLQPVLGLWGWGRLEKTSMAFTVCQACPECFLCVSLSGPPHPVKSVHEIPQWKFEDLVPIFREITVLFGVGRPRAKPRGKSQECLQD